MAANVNGRLKFLEPSPAFETTQQRQELWGSGNLQSLKQVPHVFK